MKKTSLLIGVSALALSVAHAASAQNLVQNGSFEGTDGLAEWSIGGTAGDVPMPYLPVAIQYNQSSDYPTGAQGESVPTDNAASASPDAAGLNGVYFVSDAAKNLSVHQTVYLTPGSYQIGFDSYDTYNGYGQPYDATLTADIAGVQLANYALSSAAAGVWTTHAGTALITAAGYYTVAFIFNTDEQSTTNPPQFPAKDAVIDRAYVVAVASGGTGIAPVAHLYWDGDAAANANNGLVDGGNGTWTATSPNFTDQGGLTNGAYYPQPGTVVFEGAPGTVTVDNGDGPISVTGMQFLVNGYDIVGAPIALSGTGATVQVGDGTAANAGYAATIAAALTGSGGLIKTGLGALILTGQNSYAGGTTIDAGSISINSAGALGPGAVTMDEGTTLGFGSGFTLPNDIVFAQAGDPTIDTGSNSVTLTGAISGAGTLDKAGSGTLTLPDAEAYTGGTQIQAGSIAFGDPGALGSGALTMNQGTRLAFGGAFTLPNDITLAQAGGSIVDTGSNAATLSGVISGPGTLDKAGAGTLTLTNTETYTGGTEIQSGTLKVGSAAAPDASLAAGLVTVDAGATLGGFGTIAGSVTNNGTLDNNNNFAPLGLTVGGNYSQGATGKLLIGVTPGSATLLKVSGKAKLDGAASFAYAAGTYHPATLEFLGAAGGVTGSFSSAGPTTTQPAGLNIGVAYKADEADLVLAAPVVPVTPARPATPVLTVAPNDGRIFSAQNFMFAEANQDAVTSLLGRTLPDGDGNTFYNMSGEGGPEVRAWTDGMGNFINTNSHGGVPGLHTTSGGDQTGVDIALPDQSRLGFALGYGRNTLNDGDGGSASQDVFRLSLYGSQTTGPVGLSGVISYAHAWDNSERATGFGAAKTQWGNDAFTGALQASAPFNYRILTVTPSAGFTVSAFSSADFVESAPAGFALSGNASSVTSISPFATVGVSHTLITASGTTITPDAEVGYRDDGAAQGGSVSLTAADGTSFGGNQFETERNGALLGASVTAHRGQFTGFAKYSAMVAGNWSDQRVEAGLRYAF